MGRAMTCSRRAAPRDFCKTTDKQGEKDESQSKDESRSDIDQSKVGAIVAGVEVKAIDKPEPTRLKNGNLTFEDHPEFHPNLTPGEVLQLGSFGGTYYRDIKSGITGKHYTNAWEEFEHTGWFDGLSKGQYASGTYHVTRNKYGVKSGQDLDAWEDKKWITAIDPYGWFHWYCRFYLGRRTTDDTRQISRWRGVCGDKGRWKNNLIGKCVRAGKAYDDENVSPVVRQTLQHWGYRLTAEDYNKRGAVVAKQDGLPFEKAPKATESTKRKSDAEVTPKRKKKKSA